MTHWLVWKSDKEYQLVVSPEDDLVNFVHSIEERRGKCRNWPWVCDAVEPSTWTEGNWVWIYKDWSDEEL